MTPVLQAVYDALLERASRPPFQARAQSLRAQFFERCGQYESDHPGSGPRDAAAWEDALVRGGLAREIAAELDDPAEREVAQALASAHRGVFVFDSVADRLVARDLWSGAALLVLPRDDIGRELSRIDGKAESPLCQARLLGSGEGCAVLPGTVFHPVDARPALEQVLAEARQRGLSTDRVLDAVLRMEHRWRSLSRVKVGYAYRSDALSG